MVNSNNEIKIDGSNNRVYVGAKEKFEPMIDWLKKEVAIKVKSIGKRYAPNLSEYKELNQNIELSQIFSYIDDSFFLKEFNDYARGVLSEEYVINTKNDLLSFIQKIQVSLPEDIENEAIKLDNWENNNPNNVLKLEENWWRQLDESAKTGYCFLQAKQQIEMISNKKSFLSFLKSPFTEFYEKNMLIITGEALIGKTHLMCNTALTRLNSNQPTVLFFGHEFSDGKSIISNMIQRLGVTNCDEIEFLKALNKLGVEHNTRTLIMIDAINETENPKLWRNGIIEFCEKIKSYPNLALTLSIRDVEKNKLITNANEKYIEDEIVEIQHRGFEGIGLEAVRTFCNALGVEFPKVPLHTNRLFVNPGMLFLYIEIIKETTKKFDTSIINPTTIFKTYIDNLNRKFSQENGIDEDDKVVEEAINLFISLGTQQDYTHFYIPQKIVSKEIKSIHEKVLEFLKSEGVLNKLTVDNEVNLYFTYQKFENFFIAEYLLSDFEKNKSIIFDLIKGYNGAITEALFMQIPETLDKEIFDLNVWFIRNRYICEQYITSLVWRKPNTINNDTLKYLNFLSPIHDLYENYVDTILQLSTLPNHPLNIERLHKRLLKFSITERDYHWSIYLYNSYINDGIVKRIVDWAWNKDKDFEINDDSLYLYGLTLGWFLTSSNRGLRDSATKALVNIFTNRADVFLKVLREFENVNDLYVKERLYAVGYGVVLRSTKRYCFKDLGLYIYNTIFNVDFVIEHVLLREYASFTVEFINKQIDLNIEFEKIYPPYNQNHNWTFPKIEKSEVEKYQEDYPSIYHSTLGWDFKRYKIYPYANYFLNLKISGRPHKKLPKERYDDFFENLTEEQTRAYDKTKFSSDELLKILNDQVSVINKLDESVNYDIGIKVIKELKQSKLNQSNFKELLTHEQLKEYNEIVVNYFDRDKNQFNIDIKSIKRLVFLEAIKFGWDKELFEEFDGNVNKWDRHEHRSERIGKKYQWIALHKVLAKLLDNYEYQSSRSDNKISQYIGTFQFSVRDIDPTTILKQKQKTDAKWWFNVTDEFENKEISDLEWMNSTEKLPKLSDMLNLTHNNKEYLILDMNFSIDGNQNSKKYRNLYYSINSFVIKKDDLILFKEFAKDKSFYARKMPHSSQLHDIFLREYPHSKSFEYFNNSYNSQVDWDNSFGNDENRLPCKVLLTATAYFNEAKGYDYSVDNSIEIRLPNKYLIEQMDLRQTLNDGEWVNQNGEVVFFDPTIKSCCVSPYNEDGVLVTDKKLLLEFLEKKGYALIWVMWGEKQVKNSDLDNGKDDFLGIAEIDGFACLDKNKIIDSQIKILFGE
ncbi:MAG: ATP-binding protein [Sulfurimonas sp.]|nr:ATP-binding protein [Sulfurimonas sp.]